MDSENWMPMPNDQLSASLCDEVGIARGTRVKRVYLREEAGALTDLNLEIFFHIDAGRHTIYKAIVATESRLLYNQDLKGKKGVGKITRHTSLVNLVPANQTYVYIAGFRLMKGTWVLVGPRQSWRSGHQTIPRLGLNQAYYEYEDGVMSNRQDTTDFVFQVRWILQNPA